MLQHHFEALSRRDCEEIARRLVPKRTKTIWRTQVRKFHFASICNVLPCELRLFWYSTRVLNRHLANKLPTCGQQSADKRPTVGRLLAEDFRKIGKQQLADSWPTIGQQLADCRPTVGQLLSDCWPTVGRQFFGGAVLHFFPEDRERENEEVNDRLEGTCWCTCERCETIPTQRECVCCQEEPESESKKLWKE